MRGEVESSWLPGVEVGAGEWEGTWGEDHGAVELGPCVGMGDLCLCLVGGSPLDPFEGQESSCNMDRSDRRGADCLSHRKEGSNMVQVHHLLPL